MISIIQILIYIYIYITKIYFPKPPLQTGLGDILHLSFH